MMVKNGRVLKLLMWIISSVDFFISTELLWTRVKYPP
jgi:hypothetical protein